MLVKSNSMNKWRQSHSHWGSLCVVLVSQGAGTWSGGSSWISPRASQPPPHQLQNLRKQLKWIDRKKISWEPHEQINWYPNQTRTYTEIKVRRHELPQTQNKNLMVKMAANSWIQRKVTMNTIRGHQISLMTSIRDASVDKTRTLFTQAPCILTPFKEVERKRRISFPPERGDTEQVLEDNFGHNCGEYPESLHNINRITNREREHSQLQYPSAKILISCIFYFSRAAKGRLQRRKKADESEE